MAFFKFPKTMHFGSKSSIVDDDVSVPLESLSVYFRAARDEQPAFVIQEKVDGANVAVHFEEEWTPILQKRSGLIQESGEKWKQYGAFRQWVWEHVEDLFAICSTRYVLYGEWLWSTHQIFYDQLKDFFMAFDILDKQTNLFLSSHQVRELVGDRLLTVPLLYNSLTDGAIRNPEHFEQVALGCIQKSRFSSSQTAEGVYLRIESPSQVLLRLKLRRANFECGSHEFGSDHRRNRTLDS